MNNRSSGGAMGLDGQPNAYEVLGVPETATDREVAHAFRRLARHAHPDFLEGRPEAERRTAEDRLKQLNRAYESLQGTRRLEYDRALQQMRTDAILRAQREADAIREHQSRVEEEQARAAAERFRRAEAHRAQAEAERRIREEQRRFMEAAAYQEAQRKKAWESQQIQLVWQTFLTPTTGPDAHLIVELTRQDWMEGATFDVPYDGPPLRTKPGLAHGVTGTLRGRGVPGANGGPAGDLYVQVKHVDSRGREVRRGHRQRTVGGAISGILTGLGLIVLWGIALIMALGLIALLYAMVTGRL